MYRRSDASLLVFVSSVGDGKNRKQKSSGSIALCADCIARICDSEPLPQKLRDGIADACKEMDIKLQRALPLATKASKRVKKSK